MGNSNSLVIEMRDGSVLVFTGFEEGAIERMVQKFVKDVGEGTADTFQLRKAGDEVMLVQIPVWQISVMHRSRSAEVRTEVVESWKLVEVRIPGGRVVN